MFNFKTRLKKDLRISPERIWNHPLTLFFSLSLLIFAQALSYLPFIFDDLTHIFESPLMDKSPFFFLKESITPLPFILWKFIIFCFGKNQTEAFRITNLIFHSFNTFLVFKIVNILLHGPRKYNEKYSKENTPWPPYLAAFIFLLHPVQVESVVWISSFRILLGATFALASLWFFLKFYLLESKPFQKGKEVSSNLNFLILSYLNLFFVVISYPPMIAICLTFPFFIAFFRANCEEDKSTLSLFPIFKERSVFILTLTLLAFLLSVFLLHKKEVVTKGFGIIDLQVYVDLIITSLGQYIDNLLLPFQLNFDYQINPLTLNYLKEEGIFRTHFFMGLLGLLIGMGIALIKKTRKYSFLLLSLLFILLPNIGVINHDFNNISTVADRYLYLGLLPFSLILATAVKKISSFKSQSLIALFIFILAIVSFVQVGRWKDQKSFLRASTPLNQLSTPLLMSVANLYLKQGNYSQASEHFLEILAQDPKNLAAFNALIDLFFRDPNQRSAERVTHLLKGRILSPVETQLLPIAKIYIFLKDYDQASHYAKESLLLGIKPQESSTVLEASLDAKKLIVKDRLEELFQIYYSSNKIHMANQLNEELIKLFPKNRNYKQKRELLLQTKHK